MPGNLEQNYNALVNERQVFGGHHSIDNEENDTPRTSGVMIQVVPETTRTRWNHIEDLDSFFTRMYQYHQRHGFYVIAMDEIFQLLQFTFVVFLLTFTSYCLNFPVLFGDIPPASNMTKVTLSDVVVPRDVCLSRFGLLTWIALVMTTIILFLRLIRVCYHMTQFWDIKKFFNYALKVEDSELGNITWHEVQKKIREVQSEQQMCIHKEQLTELDIYHRILRFKNYTVGMMNKNLLPTKIKLPIIGEMGCLTQGMRFNVELVLFRGPWSPFENNWHLREEFKRANKRLELTRKLSRQIFWVAIANLILSPLIFFWQVTYIAFSYAALLRREPGVLGSRCWSQYGRLYLRHFNELDHELDARLNRAYEPAEKYISSFSSPIMAVMAKFILFVCGGILAVIILLTVYSEHVMQVEHVLTIASAITVVAVAVRNFIPNENLIWCPEQLLTTVLAHIHYMPVSWRGLAHTTNVRNEFEHFFQLKAVNLLTELFSPFVTPFVLLYSFRKKTIDVVDFFRNFTVSVVGVGDVCSFAQMDVRKHGNPDWQITEEFVGEEAAKVSRDKFVCDANQYTQGEHGKTELSLIHFTLTNPEWKMPPQAKHFLQNIRRHALKDLLKLRHGKEMPTDGNIMEQSLLTFKNMGNEYSSIAASILQSHIFSQLPSNQRRTTFDTHAIHAISSLNNDAYNFDQMLHQNLYDVSSSPTPSGLHDIQEKETEDEGQPDIQRSTNLEKSIRRGMSKIEGRLEGSTGGLLYSLYSNNPVPLENAYGLTIADMCFSALHLHEIHHKKIRRRGMNLIQSQRQIWQRPHQQEVQKTTTAAENTPLLAQSRS